MQEKDLVSGVASNGGITPIRGADIDDRGNTARFYEGLAVAGKPKPFEAPKMVIEVKCDIKGDFNKFPFTALVRNNSEKWHELKARFPNAWKSFVDNGGGFSRCGKTLEEVHFADNNAEGAMRIDSEGQIAKKVGRPKKQEV